MPRENVALCRRGDIMRITAFLIAILALSAATMARAQPGDELHAVISDYEAFARDLDPIRAAQRGDAAAAVRWPDDRQAAITANRARLDDFAARLARLEHAELSDADALERDALAYRVAIQR